MSKAVLHALRRCADEHGLLASLRRGIKEPRRMVDVASDMAQLYRRHAVSPRNPEPSWMTA